MMRMAGMLAIMPVTVFLAISFFVLSAAEKVQSAGLKKFAFAVAVMLWLCAALNFFVGIMQIFSGQRTGTPVAVQQQIRR